MSTEDIADDILEDLVGTQALRAGQGNTRQLIQYRMNAELVSRDDYEAGI